MPNIPYREAAPLTPRQRRWLAAIGALVVAGLAGVLVWAWLRPGDYTRSENGCVNVLAPSSLGGSVLHSCGADARTWCRNEFAANDRLALLVQPQCRLAGITPEPSPAAGTP
jgi:hypothetical protein